MKYKLHYFIIASLMLLTISCGTKKAEPAPQTKETEPATTIVKPAPDTPAEKSKFDDTSYRNVIKVLKDAMSVEKDDPSPKNKFNTAKAFELVARFFEENLQVLEYGFTQQDIEDYKMMAIVKCTGVKNDPVASKSLKAEASHLRAELMM